MIDHETEHVALKTAKIDKKMVPAIKWLNSLDSVFTTACCEENMEQPYFSFYCHCPLTLTFVLATISGYAKVMVDYWNGLIRYEARFYSVGHFDSFKDVLEKGQWRQQFEKYIRIGECPIKY